MKKKKKRKNTWKKAEKKAEALYLQDFGFNAQIHLQLIGSVVFFLRNSAAGARWRIPVLLSRSYSDMAIILLSKNATSNTAHVVNPDLKTFTSCVCHARSFLTAEGRVCACGLT